MKRFLIWTIVLVGLGYGGTKFYLHHKVGTGVDNAITLMSPYALVKYKGVSSTMLGELTIDGISVNMVGFDDDLYIERLGIDTPSFLSLLKLGDIAQTQGSSENAMPDYFGFIAEGVHVPVDADYYKALYNLKSDMLNATDLDTASVECVGRYGFSPKALAGLGYSEQVMSVSTTFRQDGSHYIVEMVFDFENMWNLSLDLKMVGDFMTETAKGSAYRPKMTNMHLQLTDQSLNQRVEKYCGQRGLTADETLTAQLDAFKFMGKSNGIVFDKYIVEPYKEFLAGKSTFVVTAEPADPVDLSRLSLYKPSDVPALLNISALAKQ